MEKGDKGSAMIRMGVSGWMFLLVPAYTGCPGSKAVKRSLLLVRARRRRKLISNKLYWHCCELVKLSELINYRRKKRMSLCVNSSLMTVTYPSLQHRLEPRGRTEVPEHHSRCYTTTHLLAALFPGLPRWAATRKVKPIWILLKEETVSGNGISWTIYYRDDDILYTSSAPCSTQITMPAPHRPVFYRLDALPAAQPTAS